MAKSVLITGSSGFVGRHLVDLCLERGFEVHGLSRSGHGPDSNSSWHQHTLDLSRESSELGSLVGEVRPDYLFHLAARASVSRSWQNPQETIEFNIGSTIKVLEAILKHSPQTNTLVACSGEEYGPVDDQLLPVKESQPLRPQNPYSLSKAQVDLVSSFYADSQGMHLARARAFNHFGPGQSDTYVAASYACQIAAAELKGRDRVTIKVGNTAVKRDFTDVRDVVQAYLLILELGEPAVYNVCSGRSLAISELIEQMAQLTRLEVSAEVDPARLRENEVMDIRGSNEKLAQDTGWQPTIKLETTVADTLNWWRQRLKERDSLLVRNE